MTRSILRPSQAIKTLDVFDDTLAAGSGMETATDLLEDLLQNIISQQKRTLAAGAGNWFDDLVTPSALETGVQRGTNDLNDALHLVEKKRVLKCVWGLNSITIAGAGDTFDILGTGQLPGNTTAAVGSVTTLGTVVAAHGGTFGTHALDEVSGPTAISPRNLVQIVDAGSRDPVLDAGDKIYGLLQSENASDGHTITDTTPNRVQISFVKVNGAGTDLIAITAGAMDGVSYDYCYVERVRLEDLNEADFLGGANVDVPAGANVTRQAAYDNQGATVVNTLSNATLDLGTGLFWEIGDDDSAVLFRITEGSAGSNTAVLVAADVDVFDIDAVATDFLNGITVNSGGTRPIEVGVTDGLLRSTAGDLEVRGTGELLLNDGNLIAEGTWAGPGVKLTETQQEAIDYEAEFGGEVSLFNAIVQAANADNRQRAVAEVTVATIAANTLIEGPGGPGSANISADLLDYENVSFVDDVEIFINGQLQRNGANAAANHDVYPSAVVAEQQVGAFFAEYALLGAPGNPDVIQMFITGAP